MGGAGPGTPAPGLTQTQHTHTPSHTQQTQGHSRARENSVSSVRPVSLVLRWTRCPQTAVQNHPLGAVGPVPGCHRAWPKASAPRDTVASAASVALVGGQCAGPGWRQGGGWGGRGRAWPEGKGSELCPCALLLLSLSRTREPATSSPPVPRSPSWKLLPLQALGPLLPMRLPTCCIHGVDTGPCSAVAPHRPVYTACRLGIPETPGPPWMHSVRWTEARPRLQPPPGLRGPCDNRPEARSTGGEHLSLRGARRNVTFSLKLEASSSTLVSGACPEFPVRRPAAPHAPRRHHTQHPPPALCGPAQGQ